MVVSNVYNSLLATLAVVAVACGTPEQPAPATSFTASLNVHNEATGTTPDTISTNAAATATFDIIPGDSLSYTITITSPVPDSILFAHIHSGAAGSNGPVRVNLCGTGAPAPACPAHSGTVSGHATVATGTGAISFDSLLVLMRSFNAYANVHGASHQGGEIRGQIFGVRP